MTAGEMVSENQPAIDTAPVLPEPDSGVPQAAAPIIGQEFAVSQEVYNTRFELYQYTPDILLTKKGFRILEQMYTDDQVFMALSALKIMRLSSGFEIKEASTDKMDIRIADEVADNLDRLEGSLQDGLFSLMGALEMGWSLHEKIWDFWKVGPWEGNVRLKDIKSKNPQWFNPSVDDYNNLTGVVMISPPAYGRKLPHDKFVVYSFQKRYQNIFGTSRIRALYDWWYIKGLAKQALAVLTKKYGRKTPIGEYPPTMQPAQRQAYLNALVKMGTEAAILVPQGSKINFADALNHGAEGLLAIIEKADQNIVRVSLGQTMSSGTSSGQAHKGGGQAGGGVGGGGGRGGQALQELTLNMYLNYIGRDMSDKPMAQIIKDIVDYNYHGVVRYPTFKFKQISSDDLTPMVDSWVKAAQAGAVQPGPDDEERIREILQFPSLPGKTPLRPNRYNNKIAPVVDAPHAPIAPQSFPTGGYRPPTPSAPGLPANYSETTEMVKGGIKRARTLYESHIDYAESLEIQEADGVRRIVPAAGKVLRASVDKLLEDIRRQDLTGPGAISKVNKLIMRGKGELNAVLRDGLQAVAHDAMRQARRELRAKGASAKLAEIRNLEPREVLALIKAKSFDMAGNISDDVLKRVQSEIYQGVKGGKSYKDMVAAIEASLHPYFLEGEIDEVAVSGPRLETVVRTNVSEAYNEAKKAIYLDPALDGFVVAFQYSAILDDRVRPSHAEMDGRCYPAEASMWDEATPPNGFNCRCTLIPITKMEKYEPSDESLPADFPDEGFK